MQGRRSRSLSACGAFSLVLVALLLLTGAPAFAAAVSAPENVSRDAERSILPRVAQDPDGNLHVVWDEEGARRVLYAKGIWNGATYVFGPKYEIADTGSFGFSTPSVVVAPNGQVMVAWSQRRGNDDIGYVQSWDGRADRPSGSPIALGNGIQSSLAVDSRSRFHIAWNGNFKIQYCQWDGGGGCTKRDTFGVEGASNNNPDIIVDSNDAVHVAWHTSSNGIQYRARPANGEWGDIQRIDGGNFVQISADRQGNVYLAWSRDFNIQYCRKQAGSGCDERQTFTVGDDIRPSLGVTPDGDVLIVFQDTKGKQLNSVLRENGQWSGPTRVAAGPTFPEVTARPYTNRLAFVWSADYDIQQITITTRAATPPAPPPQNGRMFPETGQLVSGRILSFWEQNGGLPVFGLPLNAEDNRQTLDGAFRMQLFERNRLELHPENAAPYDVLLGRLGGDVLYQQGRPWETLPRDQPKAGCKFFAETQQNVCEPFLSYWRAFGLELGDRGNTERESLALFGLPLTGVNVETNGDGWTGQTQWFERARFEYHPENPDPYKILLGRLGAEVR